MEAEGEVPMSIIISKSLTYSSFGKPSRARVLREQHDLFYAVQTIYLEIFGGLAEKNAGKVPRNIIIIIIGLLTY